MPHTPGSLPDFVNWPSFPFEGELRVKKLQDPVDVEPARKGEDPNDCMACNAPEEAYIWVSDRWRVRAMDRPTGLPMVLILESRSHLDLGDLPNLLAAELGVMTVRLEKAIRSLDGVARVHVNRWGDGSAHLHMWFLARPTGRLQLRGTFLSLWDDILPPIPESQWRENLAMVAAWLAEFGGRPLAEPPRIDWKAPGRLDQMTAASLTSLDSPERPHDEPDPDDDGTGGNGADGNGAWSDESGAAVRNADAGTAADTEGAGGDGSAPADGPATETERDTGVTAPADSAGADSAAQPAPDATVRPA